MMEYYFMMQLFEIKAKFNSTPTWIDLRICPFLGYLFVFYRSWNIPVYFYIVV